MLVAYIDEFGHEGPFIDSQHRKYNQHPAFGYAGIVLPAESARDFGACFKRKRNQLFKTLVEASPTPSQFEKKGNEYFSTGSIESFPSYTRVFRSLISDLTRLGGNLFYYGREKPIGPVSVTGRSSRDTVEHALRETLNRLGRHADQHQSHIMIIADAITDKTRKEIAATMYGHIYQRSSEYAEMKRIVEVPLHIESKLNSNVQFADWVCALVARASHYQLIRDSEFRWASERFAECVQGRFTWESALHTDNPRDKIHNSALFAAKRTKFPPIRRGSIGDENPQLAAFYDTLRRDE
ncbi:DUF3800 domain-containing protein [Microbacterium resistens]